MKTCFNKTGTCFNKTGTCFRTFLRHNCHEFSLKMAGIEETYFSALDKEAAMGEDLAFIDR